MGSLVGLPRKSSNPNAVLRDRILLLYTYDLHPIEPLLRLGLPRSPRTTDVP